MFGIGTTEILIILVVVLLVIGPTKLPEVAKTLGKGMAEFKRMSSDVKETIDWETQVKEEEDSKSEDTSTGKGCMEVEGNSLATDEDKERPVDEANPETTTAQEKLADNEKYKHSSQGKKSDADKEHK